MQWAAVRIAKRRRLAVLRIDLISLFPEMVRAWGEFGVTARAVRGGRVLLHTWNPRDYTKEQRGMVDDRPFGGGPGMVMMYQPLQATIRQARRENPAASVACMSPQGHSLDQRAVRRLAKRSGLILIAGRYAGIDQRLLDDEVDEQWSIGDYVLSGGELPALVLVDAVVRLLPGVLGNADSVAADSFHEGLLGSPQYTRPESLPEGSSAPGILLSGHHDNIRRWRLKQSLGATWLRRPELLEGVELNVEQATLLAEFKSEREDASGKC